MADYTRTAEINIVIPDRELRGARADLEDALADIPVGISGSSGGAGGGASASSAREQRRRRREFRWARQRTSDIETQTELLEQIADDAGSGGGGGGGGGIIDTIVGEGSDIVGDVGGATALTGAATALTGSATALTGAAAAIGGASLVDALSGALNKNKVRVDGPVGVEDTTLEVEEPTLEVDDPSPLDVDDPSPLGIEEAPTLGIEDPPTLMIDKPEWVPIQVDPLEIEVDAVSRGGGGRATNRRTRGSEDFGSRFRDGVRNIPLVGDEIARADREITERIFDITPGVSRKDVGSSRPSRNTGGQGGSPNVQASTGETNVNVNVNVDSAVQETTDELRREQDRERQQVKREMEQEIERVKREITGATSGLGGGGQIR